MVQMSSDRVGAFRILTDRQRIPERWGDEKYLKIARTRRVQFPLGIFKDFSLEDPRVCAW